jgi:nickel-dependent lactate racemase
LEFWIPYGTTEVPVRVPDDNFYKILEPPKPQQTKDPATLVSQTLDNPVGDASISPLSKAGSAAIVVDPTVPPEFVQATIEQLKTRLAQLGVSPITLFVRKRTCVTSMPGKLAAETIQVEPSQGTFSEIGKTPSGTRVSLRNDFLACNVKICLNTVTPHFATGFTGGPEAIVPGVASKETVAANRSLLIQGVPSHQDSWGPVLTDMFEASKLAGPVFNIAFVPDGHGGIDSVFSGELETSFKEATSRYVQLHSPRIDRKPDIVVLAAGQTLGMDLYHSVRILSNAWDIARKDGTLILAAECSKGLGDLSFLDYSRKFEDRKTLSSELRHHFKLGAHVSLLLKEALERNRIQLVSVLPDHYVRMFNLKSAKTASAAILSSIRAEGKEAKILILTRGDLTLPTIQQT